MKCYICHEKMQRRLGSYDIPFTLNRTITLCHLNIFYCSCGEEGPVIPRLSQLVKIARENKDTKCFEFKNKEWIAVI